MTAARLDHTRMIRRAAAELRSGEAVALGPGLPGRLPDAFAAFRGRLVLV